MRFSYLLITLCSTTIIDWTDGEKILAIFPFQARSHYKVYESLLTTLSDKGHQVKVITHFPQKKPRAGFIDIDVSSTLPDLISSLGLNEVENFTRWQNILYLTKYGGVGICDPVLNDPNVKNLIKSKEKFDVFIVEIFATECFLGIAHVLNIKNIVGVVTSVALPWSNEILRSPENPSYVPNWFSPYTDRMNYYERLLNSGGLLASKLLYRILSDWPSYEIAKRHLGEDLPNFDVLRSKISLILTNGHPAVSTTRPLAPGLKEIGGIHIPISGPPPLERELEDWLNSEKARVAGVIYLSMGSQIDPSSMPKKSFDVLRQAFERLPQQILWKCSADKMPVLPNNVKCIEWAPQLSILCHPNVRLFITHGGLLGTQEAIYCGIPILGMPLFGDQYLNMAYFKDRGIGLELDYRHLTYDGLSSSLNKLLTNVSFAKAAQRASKRFKDRPIAPLDEAIYWIEYIIRYGPSSLRSGAMELAWYQYLLIDIILTVIIVLFTFLWAVKKMSKFLSSRLRGTRSTEVNKKKTE